MADKRHRRKTPQFYYNQQKQNAKHRGIPWEFDFEDWWKVWRDSGKWGERGCKLGQFVMARRGDAGPYSVENVVIMEAGKNGSEALINWPEKKRARKAEEAKMEECCTAFAKVVVEKPKPVITVEQFKASAPKFENIFAEPSKDNFKSEPEKLWTFSKVICLMFPKWGPRWLGSKARSACN
jgi:hypothetical protein